jgi:hypothetical protein
MHTLRAKDNVSAVSLVREGGLEPPRACAHKVLSLARLPFRHSRFRTDREASRTILHGTGYLKKDGLTGGDGYFKVCPAPDQAATGEMSRLILALVSTPW